MLRTRKRVINKGDKGRTQFYSLFWFSLIKSHDFKQTNIMKTLFQFALFFISISIFSQQPATKADVVKQSLDDKEKLTTSSLVKNVPFTNIGPTIMSGRVADIAVNPNDPTEFYVGYASGGLWYTNNNGTTFTPILDNSATQNVGDIDVDWKKEPSGLELEKRIHLVLLMQESEF